MSNDEIATYLGYKGYTIMKENLTIEEQELIRKELTVKPFVPKTSLSQPTPFPIYRESKKKMYIPRFYGQEYYGEPEETRILDTPKLNINFKGELRDFQKPIVNKYIQEAKKNGGGLLEIHCGAGKTVMALNIISQLKVKTLVIVHKEFLLRQWKERIEQFLPGVKIGRIQGETMDTEGKEIVIGMLQSLSMKDYPRKLFQQFGLTIIDECHHIGAEVFSRALFTVVSKYMLGLSATMERKDSLSKVFKMFLGPIVFSKKSDNNADVLVKAIYYSHDDDEFSETDLNYRGQVHYSKMIKKLCEFNRRTEFILKVLKDTIDNGDKEQQIMIIAHNKNLLKYLFEAIEHRKIATVGYYVGGMKEEALKASENKQVIIATYAMAEEALDIKTLTTLIMATPKTDVRQAVGRILRQKHKQALVIDIVDQHDIFQRQWNKRRRYYNKKKYNIICADVENYKKNKWEDISKKKKFKSVALKKDAFLQGKCMIMD
uniref:Helicase ATP-binding domain-containing protein n=1 Tax=viral metagenome TaxID=1070528 RepID=A0A6C0CNY8_9ZZZZ